ncbi:hypothetical protein STENM327S_05396 [Streptomyces tendae]
MASAIQAGWPSWRVPRTAPSSTQWYMVCPCETTRSAPPPHSSRTARTAASANACPMPVSSRATASTVAADGGRLLAIRSRSAFG